MPTLDLSNYNIICAVAGGFTALYGLVSYLLKEKFYLSEARMSYSYFFRFTTPLQGLTS